MQGGRAAGATARFLPARRSTELLGSSVNAEVADGLPTFRRERPSPESLSAARRHRMREASERQDSPQQDPPQ